MDQLIYKDKFFVYGKISEITKYLRQLSIEFRTVRDFIEYYTKNMN